MEVISQMCMIIACKDVYMLKFTVQWEIISNLQRMETEN